MLGKTFILSIFLNSLNRAAGSICELSLMNRGLPLAEQSTALSFNKLAVT